MSEYVSSRRRIRIDAETAEEGRYKRSAVEAGERSKNRFGRASCAVSGGWGQRRRLTRRRRRSPPLMLL